VASNSPVDLVPASDDEHAPDFQVGFAFPNLRKAAGVGQPFERDFRFPIADCQLIKSHSIGDQPG